MRRNQRLCTQQQKGKEEEEEENRKKVALLLRRADQKGPFYIVVSGWWTIGLTFVTKWTVRYENYQEWSGGRGKKSLTEAEYRHRDTVAQFDSGVGHSFTRRHEFWLYTVHSFFYSYTHSVQHLGAPESAVVFYGINIQAPSNRTNSNTKICGVTR